MRLTICHIRVLSHKLETWTNKATWLDRKETKYIRRICHRKFAIEEKYICWSQEANLIAVVFPTPGGPISKSEPPLCTRSLAISALPEIARPTLHVRPTILPALFLIALIRCKVRSIPARLSSPKSPTCCKCRIRCILYFLPWISS